MVIIIRQKTNKRPPYTRLRPELALTQTQIAIFLTRIHYILRSLECTHTYIDVDESMWIASIADCRAIVSLKPIARTHFTCFMASSSHPHAQEEEEDRNKNIINNKTKKTPNETGSKSMIESIRNEVVEFVNATPEEHAQ